MRKRLLRPAYLKAKSAQVGSDKARELLQGATHLLIQRGQDGASSFIPEGRDDNLEEGFPVAQ